jgi:hypothetical protein
MIIKEVLSGFNRVRVRSSGGRLNFTNGSALNLSVTSI